MLDEVLKYKSAMDKLLEIYKKLKLCKSFDPHNKKVLQKTNKLSQHFS